MTSSHIICHYSEIGLKGKNRKYFESKLVDNIKYSLRTQVPGSYDRILRYRGRIIITLTELGIKQVKSLERLLSEVFGLAYFFSAIKITADIDEITRYSIEMLQEHEFETFRVTARKSDTNFPFSVMNVHEHVGGKIIDAMGKKVKLKDSDIICYIDIIHDDAYLYSQKISGPGGLPVGTSGNVLVMLSGGIDSPVAAYYAKKRGAKPDYIHFHSVPYVSDASIEKVKSMVEILTKDIPTTRLYIVPFAKIQDAIMDACDPKLRVLLYRRFMLKISEQIALQNHLLALYTGESLGQVASQTLQNINVVQADTTQITIHRPLIGLDKQEIIHQAEAINTFEISILPHQDCCTLFVPKHPATKARYVDIQKAESNLNVNELVQQALEGSETQVF